MGQLLQPVLRTSIASLFRTCLYMERGCFLDWAGLGAYPFDAVQQLLV